LGDNAYILGKPACKVKNSARKAAEMRVAHANIAADEPEHA